MIRTMPRIRRAMGPASRQHLSTPPSPISITPQDFPAQSLSSTSFQSPPPADGCLTVKIPAQSLQDNLQTRSSDPTLIPAHSALSTRPSRSSGHRSSRPNHLVSSGSAASVYPVRRHALPLSDQPLEGTMAHSYTAQSWYPDSGIGYLPAPVGLASSTSPCQHCLTLSLICRPNSIHHRTRHHRTRPIALHDVFRRI